MRPLSIHHGMSIPFALNHTHTVPFAPPVHSPLERECECERIYCLSLDASSASSRRLQRKRPATVGEGGR